MRPEDYVIAQMLRYGEKAEIAALYPATFPLDNKIIRNHNKSSKFLKMFI